MALFFQLFPIGSNEPAGLNAIDEEICALMGKEVHPTKYCCEWFDCIGFKLASGKSFDDIIVYFESAKTEDVGVTLSEDDRAERVSFCDDQIKIAEYLKTKYTPNAWYGRGR